MSRFRIEWARNCAGMVMPAMARAAPSGRLKMMQVYLLKSKIHRAAVTGGDVNYEGSLTIDQDWMDEVGLVAYERILCSNMANGNRFETYAIPGRRGAGEIILNGAAAHLGKKGDLLTIMSFAGVARGQSRRWKPRILVLGRGQEGRRPR